MNNLKDILDFYKADKITNSSLELEIARNIKNILPISVVVDDKTSIASTNSSYLADIVPEAINGIIKTTFVFDASMLKNKLSSEEGVILVHLLERYIQKSIKSLNDFIIEHKNTEVSYLECLSIYAKIYLNFLLSNEKCEFISSLIAEKTIRKEDLNELILSIELGNESQEKVVEFILVNKLLPEFALQKAEELFKRINTPKVEAYSEEEYIEKPLENYWYATIAAKITGTFNPETHKDLDPFYVPSSNLNK